MEALEAQLMKRRTVEVTGVIERIQRLMAQYELSVGDVEVKRRRGRAVIPPLDKRVGK